MSTGEEQIEASSTEAISCGGITTLNPALLELREQIDLPALLHSHTFFNHKANLTEYFLYQYLLGKALREGEVTALMPFARPFSSDIRGLQIQSISGRRARAFIDKQQSLRLAARTLYMCGGGNETGIQMLAALPTYQLFRRKPLLLIIDPIKPDSSYLDESLWPLLRDSRHLNLAVWLHTSPLFVSPSILSQFANAVVLNPTVTETKSLQNIWGDIPHGPRENVATYLSAFVFGAHDRGRKWKFLEYQLDDDDKSVIVDDQYAQDRKQDLESKLAKVIAAISKLLVQNRVTLNAKKQASLEHKLFSLIDTLSQLEEEYKNASRSLSRSKIVVLPRPLARDIQMIKNQIVDYETKMIKPTVDLLRGKVDFGIITVREDEFKAVLRQFPSEDNIKGQRNYALSRVQAGGPESYLLAIVRCTEQGQGEAQAVATDLINDLDPHWLLIVGIAGGVPDDDFTLGDVIAAMRLHDFSVGAVLEGETSEYSVGGGRIHKAVRTLLAHLPAMQAELEDWNSDEAVGMPRPTVQFDDRSFYGSSQWKQKVKKSIEHHFERSETKRLPLYTTGAVVSSNQLVRSPQLIQQWRKSARHLRAVEMELGGIYRAAERMEFEYPVLAIRGISDIVGFNRSGEWTSYACLTAAAFTRALLRAMLKNGNPEPRSVQQRGKP